MRAADLSPEARAKVALALLSSKSGAVKKASCGCTCAERGCNCTFPGECGDPNCCCVTKTKNAPGPVEYAVYRVQYERALRDNKPLLIWIGETCPACESKWTDYVHARLTEYDGKNGTETGPEVIVAKPDGLGGMSIVGRLDGIPSATSVSSLLNPAPQQTVQASPMIYLPPPMPMMPMTGGFGGGFGGGMMMGGGGGGCSS